MENNENKYKGRIQNKVSLITGAGGAIGRSIVFHFLKEGSLVSFCDINKKAGEETLIIMKEKFGNNVPVKFYQVDITNENQVKQWIESTINHFGNIDILVNNAAAFIFGTVEEASSEDWDRVFNVNVKGYALCSKYAIPHMKKNGKGSIIHIGSQSGFIAQPKFTPYNSSKGAILQLTRCMAMDYGEFNIRVNCICPGTIDTPATSEHAKKLGISKEELVKLTIKDHFLKKLGSVDDVAYAVLFFASDESSFITGTSLLIDGGNTAH